MATLGAKSTLKRVNRKEILAVNVPRACETIITPEAPMALRLQSNLLCVHGAAGAAVVGFHGT